jgi:uncharacterized membrane protein YfcA
MHKDGSMCKKAVRAVEGDIVMDASLAKQLIIICPLTLLGGFLDASSGGGGLISLPAYMFAGLNSHSAVATYKLSSAMGTSVAALRMAKDGHIQWSKAWPCMAVAAAGSVIGAGLAIHTSERVLGHIMLIVIPVTAFYILKTQNLDSQDHELKKSGFRVRSATIAFLISVYDGLYGPGTGTFIILLMSRFAGCTLLESVGLSRAILLATNISALIVFLVKGKVVICLGIAGGAAGIIGNLLGVSLVRDKGNNAVKPLMIIVLIIAFIKIASESMM